MFSDMIAMVITLLLMTNSLTSALNNISEKWPFKDFTERNSTAKELREL